MSDRLRHHPIVWRVAKAFVGLHHRHNEPDAGMRWALGAYVQDELVGVVVVGRPKARLLQCDGVAEVTRLVTKDGAPKNTCSFLYGAARRVWQAMGGRRLLTYTLKTEPGTSLVASGWTPTRD